MEPVRRRVAALLLGLTLCCMAVAASPADASSPLTARTTSCQRTLARYPVVEPGDRSPAVATLQCTLNDLGTGPVTVDGYYGPETAAAVTEVEGTFEGVPPHPGRIDAGFWALLFGRQLPYRLPKPGDHGHDVAVLQRALRASGFTLVVDGDYGNRTRRVVRAYREQFGNLNFGLRNGFALPGARGLSRRR